MKLYLLIISTTLFLITLSYPAYSGTTLQNLSKTTKYKDMDEYLKSEAKKAKEGLDRASIDFYEWNLNELNRNIERGYLSLADSDLNLLYEHIKKHGDKDSIMTEPERRALWKAVKARNINDAKLVINLVLMNRESVGAYFVASSEIIE